MTHNIADVGAYVVKEDGEIAENEAAKATAAAYFTARCNYESVERSFAGARIAKLFKEHEWLGKLTFVLRAESEYDDQGGYFRCVDASVSDIAVADDATVPELADGEAFDPDGMADAFTDELQEDAGSLYGAFGDAYSYEDFEFTVTREQIGDLLLEGEINGAVAFGRFFRDRHTVRPDSTGAESEKAEST